MGGLEAISCQRHSQWSKALVCFTATITAMHYNMVFTKTKKELHTTTDKSQTTTDEWHKTTDVLHTTTSKSHTGQS